jgi:hypothetical protein
MQDDDWMKDAHIRPVPDNGLGIPEPEHWHLQPVSVRLGEDGETVMSWCEVESPNLAMEWTSYHRYVPRRLYWN